MSTAADGQTSYPGLLQAIQYPTYRQDYDYDKANRRIQTHNHLDDGSIQTSTTQYDLAGNRISTTQAADTSQASSTHYQYDALNRLITITDPLNQITAFSYDARDNLTQVTDPNGHSTQYTYDRADRKTQEIRPNGQTSSYQYDTLNRLTRITDPDNRITTLTYDLAGQLTTQSHSDTTEQQHISYSYDKNGNLAGLNDGSYSETYVYDANNQKTQTLSHYGVFSLSHSTSFDAAGNKGSETAPDGRTTVYEWQHNQLQRIGLGHPTASQNTQSAGSILINSYNWNQPTRRSIYGGSTEILQYDALNRQTNNQLIDPAGHLIQGTAQGYDPRGNINQQQTTHSLTEATKDKQKDYQYDQLDRLTQVDHTQLINPQLNQQTTDQPTTDTAEAWQYDPNGNRTQDQQQPGSWQYDLNDQLIQSPTTSYQYDNAGNPTSTTDSQSQQSKIYHYNAANRLSQITDHNNQIIATYQYDPLGRRIKKTTQTETIYFHYSDEGLIGEYTDTGTSIRQYGYDPNSTWTTDPRYQYTDQGYAFYHNDHLGTPQRLYTYNGATVWSAQYQAFGKATEDHTA